MHLYTYSAAPNPLRLSHFMNFKGIVLETTEVNIGTGEHFEDWFKEINPCCTLPTLVVDENTVLTDVISICVYLEHLHPEKPLFGASPEQYALVIGWDHSLYFEGLTAIAEIFRNRGEFFKNRAMPGKVDIPQLEVLIERGKLRLDGFWESFNDHLNNRAFIVGEQLTFADIDAYVICGFASRVKESVPETSSNIHRWLKRVRQSLE